MKAAEGGAAESGIKDSGRPADCGAPKMPVSLRVASGLYFASSAAVAGMGLLYALCPRFMPYHAQAAGLAWEEVPPRWQALHLAFQHGAGALAVAYAVLMACVNAFALRRGARWARIALPVSGAAVGLPLLSVVISLAESTGAETPTVPLALGMAVFCAAAVLSFVGKNRRSPEP